MEPEQKTPRCRTCDAQCYVSLACVQLHLEHPELFFQLSGAVSSFIPYFPQTVPLGFGSANPPRAGRTPRFSSDGGSTGRRHVKSRRGALRSDTTMWRSAPPAGSPAPIGPKELWVTSICTPGGAEEEEEEEERTRRCDGFCSGDTGEYSCGKQMTPNIII